MFGRETTSTLGTSRRPAQKYYSRLAEREGFMTRKNLATSQRTDVLAVTGGSLPATGGCGNEAEDTAVRRRGADEIRSMVITPWLGSGRRVLAAGVVGAAAARCSEAPHGIALAAGGDRQFCKDRQAGPLLHILRQWRGRGREAFADGMSRKTRFSCLLDLAVPPCMRQLVWGGDRMMVAEFMLACLGEVGLIGSSAQ